MGIEINCKAIADGVKAAVALFVWWSALAYADRGYWAVGGEYAALLLPLLVVAADCALQDRRDERGRREFEEARRG